MTDAQDNTTLQPGDRSASVTVAEGAATLLELMPGDDDVFPEDTSKPKPDTTSDTDQTPKPDDKKDEPDDDLEDLIKLLDPEVEGEEDEVDESKKTPVPDAETMYEVKADGETSEVSLEELKKGYSRHANWTRDKQKVADERRAVEAQAVEITQLRQSYGEQLDKLKKALGDPVQPDWDKLKSENPEGYLVAVADWQRDKDRRESLAVETARVASEQATELARHRDTVIQQERVKLVEAIPDYADPEKSKALTKAWTEYAPSIGLTETELGNIYDHRVLVALNKSMLYDRLVAKRDALAAKKKTAPTVPPGTKKTTGEKNARNKSDLIARAKKRGTTEAAAAALLAFEDD